MFHKFARLGGLLAAVAAGSLAANALATPLAAFADDATPNIAMTVQSTLVVVDENGKVLGELVPVPSSANTMRYMTKSKALYNISEISSPDARWHPRQSESDEFWDGFNQLFTSAY